MNEMEQIVASLMGRFVVIHDSSGNKWTGTLTKQYAFKTDEYDPAMAWVNNPVGGLLFEVSDVVRIVERNQMYPVITLAK